jgi:hypothetical protein
MKVVKATDEVKEAAKSVNETSGEGNEHSDGRDSCYCSDGINVGEGCDAAWVWQRWLL